MTVENYLTVIAGTLTSLVAGLFFAFSVSVNGGLHRLKNSEYVTAMQSINQVILNPVFLLSFFGPVILMPVAAFMQGDRNPMRFAFLLASAVVYIIGAFGVTVIGNVPLNRKLERFQLNNASAEEIAQARALFERPWNRFHAIRTILSIAATILAFVGCLSESSLR